MTKEDSAPEYSRSPLVGRIEALEVYVGLLTGVVRDLDYDSIEQLGEALKKVKEMDKSPWRMDELQVIEFEEGIDRFILATQGKYPLF